MRIILLILLVLSHSLFISCSDNNKDDNKGIELIYVESKPFKLNYYKDEKINLNGLVINAKLKNGEVISIDDYKYEVQYFDNYIKIIISYNEFSTDFNLNLLDKEPESVYLESIYIDRMPNKIIYFKDEVIDLRGISIKGVMSDKTIIDIIDYSYEVVEVSKTKKLIIIKYNDKEVNFEVSINEEDDFLEEIFIKQYPFKMAYYDGESIDLSGLIICGKMKSGKEFTICDYKVDYENQDVLITYLDKSVKFSITIKPNEKLIKPLNYLNNTVNILTKDNIINIIENCEYGVSRGQNMLVFYDKDHLINTNIYGYEVLVDNYGKVIEKGVNVHIKKDEFIISGHGTSSKIVKNIPLNSYIYYNKFLKCLYVFDGNNVASNNIMFLKTNDLYNYLVNYNEYPLKNEYVLKANEIINFTNSLYNLNDYTSINYDYIEFINDIIYKDDYHNAKYSTCEISNDLLSNKTIDSSLDKVSSWTGLFKHGGFRDKDYIVYYDKTNIRKRNNYGYEVGVSSDGIVVSKDVLVELPENGFILSGHSAGSKYINNNINIGDKIIINEIAFDVYRLVYNDIVNNYIKMYNDILKKLNNNDYLTDLKYIKEKLDETKKYIEELANLDYTYFINNILLMKYNEIIESNLTVIEYLLVNRQNINQGMWYNPFNGSALQDDTCYEGVINTLDTLKSMGINEIILSPFCGKYALYDSKIYKKSEKLNGCDYGIYGNDYLNCFITEANKRGIIINFFTQTFANKNDGLIEKHDEWYQLDYSGKRSFGSIYYYDICNDDLQKMLIESYKELLTKYKVQKVELDIIRYPSSNLYTFTDEVITNPLNIQDHGYTNYSINKFMKEFNLEGDFKTLIINSLDIRNKWLKFKQDNLDNFVIKLREVVKECNEDILLTAAVLSSYEKAKKSYLQNFLSWPLDEIEVMCYTSNLDDVNKCLATYAKLTENTSIKARIGLGILDDRDNIIDLISQISSSLSYNGYIIFNNVVYLSNKSFIKAMIESNIGDNYE